MALGQRRLERLREGGQRGAPRQRCGGPRDGAARAGAVGDPLEVLGQTIRFGWYPYLPGEVEGGVQWKALGPYRVAGRARAPDLLESSVDGVGAFTAWAYQPLSRPEVEGPGCDAEKPFYTVDHQAERSTGYVNFTSSMWAVSRFEVTNGLVKAGGILDTNKTCYRYEDAMLNVRGRGFQGFKKVVSEERLTVAKGEAQNVADPMTCGELRNEACYPRTCGNLGNEECSPNNLRTTTEFNQEFPFTNTVRKVALEGAVDGKKLGETVSWLHAVQSVTGVDDAGAAGGYGALPPGVLATPLDWKPLASRTSAGSTRRRLGLCANVRCAFRCVSSCYDRNNARYGDMLRDTARRCIVA